MPEKNTSTLIIGASLSGLASAACLQKKGLDYTIIEKADQVATPWRRHYERLHLHTSKRWSGLPYKKFAAAIPRYPSRQQVIDYLDDYRRTFNITPDFNTEAITASKEDGHWITRTNNGSYRSKCVIMATGAYTKPNPIKFPGIESFPGRVQHSFGYKTGADFKGQSVLVIGFGNSACEIAIDLFEQGAIPSMAVRSPVNVVPRDVLGIPVLDLSILLSPLPPRVADTISGPLMKWLVGDIRRLGLKKMPYGPLEGIHRDGKAPMLDIGAIRHIRDGHISIFEDIDRIDGRTVYFKAGRQAEFDAIIAAIGYYRDYADIIRVDSSRFTDLRLPASKQRFFGKDGLYFCGYFISPTGQIREIASDARLIADHIKANRNFSKKTGNFSK
jgi:indole-3-pyruvate monooxygenase